MRLSDYLDDNGISCMDFGRMVGLPMRYVAEICAGHKEARLLAALAIVRATGGQVRLSDLAGECSG